MTIFIIVISEPCKIKFDLCGKVLRDDMRKLTHNFEKKYNIDAMNRLSKQAIAKYLTYHGAEL